MKLIKIHTGHYVSEDRRFTITRKRFTHTWWLVEDNLRRISRSGTMECDTLAEAREAIKDQLTDERTENHGRKN